MVSPLPPLYLHAHFCWLISEDALQEIRAIHDMEPKASFLNISHLNSGEDETEVDLTEFTAQKEQIISHEELQYLIEKLHRFAKLQIAKLNHETGVVHDNLNR